MHPILGAFFLLFLGFTFFTSTEVGKGLWEALRAAFYVLIVVAPIYASFTFLQRISSPKPSPFWDKENYYELLGLEVAAPEDQIIRRCLELAEPFRPDIHGECPANRQRFDQIERAYHTLTDRKIRKAYDIALTEQQKPKKAMTKLRSVIWKHAEELLRKRRRLVTDKGYGILDDSKWIREKRIFISTILRPAANSEVDIIGVEGADKLIESCLDAKVRSGSSGKSRSQSTIDPIEFEHHCASILEKAGWRVSTTKASGDQGADIIAKKSGLTVVVQCKQYSQPVGNAAVQEAYAAKAHYRADKAAVVTNSTYTKSAIELAESTGVLLLHQDELQDLFSKL
ncbi:MAG: hypothetical protein FD157_677 [Rhodocyclaceae bacterium]|nr:MAG: hypothetical protein FD157_677 [Rhodocyclaceae bacterium]TND03171.1 MAG: hypothetical protein FD118_1747 [Rhodocyclaceae bacterium]